MNSSISILFRIEVVDLIDVDVIINIIVVKKINIIN